MGRPVRPLLKVSAGPVRRRTRRHLARRPARSSHQEL